ncbi:MAG: hypothetical protein ACLPV8_28390 [Steroidobacteraceae bacterium]
MKTRIALLSSIAAVCMTLVSCGGGNSASVPTAAPSSPAAPAPPPPVTMDLDTAAVLAIVQTQTSDTAEPFQVDDFAVAVIPQFDETSAPISVDAS